MQEHFSRRGLRVGDHTKTIFTITCHGCGGQNDWTFNKQLPFEPVAKKFQGLGWVIGRNRRHDLCPTCVGVKPENKLARHFKVSENGAHVPSPSELARHVDDGRRRAAAQTSNLIEKVFGQKETMPVVVLKPRPAPLPLSPPKPETPMATPDVAATDVMTALTNLQQKTLSELANLRAAVELLLDSNSQLINAVAQIVPAIARSNDTLGNRIVAAIEAIPQTPPVVVQESTLDADIAVKALKAVIGEVPRVKETAGGAAHHDTVEVERAPVEPDFAPVVLRSYPISNTTKYLTQIRFARHVFDALGFKPTDRFIFRRLGRRLQIRVDPAGAKVMRANASSAVLQTTLLGDIERLFGTQQLRGVMNGRVLQLEPNPEMVEEAA